MLRFAIIGTGKISHTFMKAALKVPGFKLEAVYSRSQDSGRAFGSVYGADKVYTTLKALGDDPEVDAVYIASPNSSHCAQTVFMLEHGKHVLCEKPIASSAQELERMMKAADGNGKILLEAMRPVFDPGFAKIRNCLGSWDRSGAPCSSTASIPPDTMRLKTESLKMPLTPPFPMQPLWISACTASTPWYCCSENPGRSWPQAFSCPIIWKGQGPCSWITVPCLGR